MGIVVTAYSPLGSPGRPSTWDQGRYGACSSMLVLVTTNSNIFTILHICTIVMNYCHGILIFSFFLFFFFSYLFELFCLATTDVRPPDLLKHKGLNILENKYGQTKAQLLLRWQVQRGNTVIVKSINPTRIASNADIFTWSLEL